MPSADDLDEEGFGNFRDTWLIKGVLVREAREILSAERQISALIDSLANTEHDFERLANVAEFAGVDDSAEDLSDHERSALREVVSDVPPFAGLELGVAGLAHALATVRVLPAASCRSHPGRSWSEAPVVFVAITEFRAKALEPLAKQSGCTFDIDEGRPELLVIRGTSVTNTMDLAEMVLANRSTFVQERGPTKRRATDCNLRQEALF